MTLIDDRCDGGCGRGFDPMGDPLLTRHPEIGPYAVFCATCETQNKERRMSEAELNAATTHDLLERYVAELDAARLFAEYDRPGRSNAARENAEAIAAEIERRCVR